MSFAADLFSGLAGFRDHLAAELSPLVGVVEADLAKLGPLVAQDVRQAEQVAKEILHGLYSGQAATPEQPPVSAAPVMAPAAPAAEPVHADAVAAPVAEQVAEPAPVAAEAPAAEPEPPTTATA